MIYMLTMFWHIYMSMAIEMFTPPTPGVVIITVHAVECRHVKTHRRTFRGYTTSTTLAFKRSAWYFINAATSNKNVIYNSTCIFKEVGGNDN